ncbi:dimethylaniline monooxygenase [N-oxide-forming] 2-like [Hyperolius riggenbachi]|uniref:dimethylaniline monooxygenase [N-oxide-forming] 2-like n=1 Tax=Hyperolius riggenbachi TaxID=752182 RepID=UPI0035A3D380
MVKTVAVIGAGVSGLAAIKACLEEGLEPTCFERSDDIGGLWRFTDKAEDGRASIYRSLVTNVSKETMAFSDFPMPADFPNYLPHHKYFEYIKLYTKKFNLVKYIQFKTVVCQVEKHPDFAVRGQWTITSESKGERNTIIFDAVLVCTGQHVHAQIPLDTFPGIKTFKGKILHSSEYKTPEDYDGKKVLIIGMGNSGVDISTELCTRASQVYLTTREGVWVLPRLVKGGYPFDLFLLCRFKNWIANLVPPAVARWMLKQFMNDHFNHELYNIQPEGIAWKEPLVNEELPSRVLSGSIIIKPGVTRFTETAAHFSDGSVVDNLDVVILGTGYDYTFPFLDESVFKKDDSKGSSYKKIIPLGIEKPTIAFIAFILPVGPTMVISELQSRWATRVFKGLLKLPDETGIKKEMVKDESRRKKWFGTAENNFRRTNYITYLDDIGSDIGVKPHIWKLFLTDPVLAFKVVFGTCNSYQYRLNGPGKWAGAREAILKQWDRIEKPLKTRIPKQDPKLSLMSLMLLIICFLGVFTAVLAHNC